MRESRVRSIDKLNPKGGYTPDNSAVICLRCNTIKSNATPDELRRIADWVEAAIAERLNLTP